MLGKGPVLTNKKVHLYDDIHHKFIYDRISSYKRRKYADIIEISEKHEDVV